MNHGSGAGKRVTLCFGSFSIPLERSSATYECRAAGVAIRTKTNLMHKDTQIYNDTQSPGEKSICDLLATTISASLPEAENKIWHAHPVWFLDGNPIAGYSKLKGCIRLLFWSGQSFDEPGLTNEGKFKAAEIRYTSIEQVNTKDLKRWLKKARTIQWDYKNIVKRKGQLERLK